VNCLFQYFLYISWNLKCINLNLFCAIKKEQIDPVFNTNSYETTAGYVELSVRFVWMAWFLFELKETFNNLETTAANSASSSDLVYSQFQDNTDMQINEIDSEPDDGDDAGDYSLRRNGKNYAPLSDTCETKSETVKRERLRSLQVFYLHYGACSMVWFIYLPCLIFVTSFVTELYRIRLVLGRVYCFILNSVNEVRIFWNLLKGYDIWLTLSRCFCWFT